MAARGVGIADRRAEGLRCATRSSARPSASRSASTRRSSSSWRRWPRGSQAAAADVRRGAQATTGASAATWKPAWPSISPPRPRCENSLEAMRIYGGYGYSKEFDDRALLPRRAADVHRRGHQRDAAHHHRAQHDRAEPGMSVALPPLPLHGLRILTFEHSAPGRSAPCTWPTSAPRSSRSRTANGRRRRRRATIGPHLPRRRNDSHFFQTFNRNKKSLTLDLKQRRRARRCSAAWPRRADAVIEQPARRSAGASSA